MKPIIFHLKRYLKDVPNLHIIDCHSDKTIYQQIKDGIKTSEYREATDYWLTRLIKPIFLAQVKQLISQAIKKGHDVIDLTDYKLHTEAIFIEGYPKGKITDNTHLRCEYNILILHLIPNQEMSHFEIRIRNVIEVVQ